jgi:hypothetical protein
MKYRRIYGVFAVLVALGGAAYHFLPSQSTPFGAADSQPVTSVTVGDLVTLSCDGHSVTWVIEPEIPYVAYGTETENLVTSFKQPGQYFIYAAYITDDAGTGIRRYPVSVAAGTAPVSPTTVPDKAEAKQLAASFRLVADSVESRLSAGILVTPEQIVKETREANLKALGGSVARWEPWFATLGGELQSANLVTMPDHIAKWRAIAAQLEQASQ